MAWAADQGLPLTGHWVAAARVSNEKDSAGTSTQFVSSSDDRQARTQDGVLLMAPLLIHAVTMRVMYCVRDEHVNKTTTGVIVRLQALANSRKPRWTA